VDQPLAPTGAFIRAPRPERYGSNKSSGTSPNFASTAASSKSSTSTRPADSAATSIQSITYFPKDDGPAFAVTETLFDKLVPLVMGTINVYQTTPQTGARHHCRGPDGRRGLPAGVRRDQPGRPQLGLSPMRDRKVAPESRRSRMSGTNPDRRLSNGHPIGEPDDGPLARSPDLIVGP